MVSTTSRSPSSLLRRASSARFASSMSRFTPIQYSRVPSPARRGSARVRNQRYFPAAFELEKAFLRPNLCVDTLTKLYAPLHGRPDAEGEYANPRLRQWQCRI